MTERFVHDGKGNLLTYTDGAGQLTRYHYAAQLTRYQYKLPYATLTMTHYLDSP